MADRTPGLLSVIIPVWNGERYLAEAIESTLRQEWHPLEIIVVDDGSTDSSAAIAERFGPPVRCLRRPHSGLAATRNAGMAEATGEFIAHFDCDDLLPPGSVATRMARFEADPSLEVVVGAVEAFFSPELDEATRARLVLPERHDRGGLSGAAIVRTEAFSKVGLLDERWRLGSDMDWMIRAGEAGIRLEAVDSVVAWRRVHGRNMSLMMKEERTDRMRILKAALDRRRASGTSPAE